MNEWSYKLELSLKTNYLGWFLHTWYLKIHTFIVTSNWMSRHLFWYGGLCPFTNIKVATNSVDIMSTHGKAIANKYEDLLIPASPLMPSRRQKVWPQFFSFSCSGFYTTDDMSWWFALQLIDRLWSHWGFLAYHSFSPYSMLIQATQVTYWSSYYKSILWGISSEGRGAFIFNEMDDDPASRLQSSSYYAFE